MHKVFESQTESKKKSKERLIDVGLRTPTLVTDSQNETEKEMQIYENDVKTMNCAVKYEIKCRIERTVDCVKTRRGDRQMLFYSIERMMNRLGWITCMEMRNRIYT